MTPHEIRRKYPLWKGDKLNTWKRRLRAATNASNRAHRAYCKLAKFADDCCLEIERLETGG